MEVPELEPTPQLSVRARAPYFVRTLRIAALLSLAITAIAAIAYPFIQPVIPLFYSVSQPESQLAPKFWIFLFPIFAWFFTFLHFTLLRNLDELEGNIEKIFCWTTVGIVGVTGLLLIRVILLVL